MEEVKTPIYKLYYSGKDHTDDIAPMVESLDYEESLEGRAGSISIQLNNADRRWLAGWRPKVDDEMRLQMGYADSPLLNCGAFWIDEVEANGARSGERFAIKAMSNLPSSIQSPQQTRVIDGGFGELARDIAGQLGMSVEGDLSGALAGVAKGTGLGILMEQAKRLGKALKTEGNKIIIYPVERIKSDSYRVAIAREDVVSYRITDKAVGRYTYCECRYWDSGAKKEIRGHYEAGIAGGGKATIWQEVKSEEEAADQAKRWVEEANKKGVEVEISTVGNVKLISGVGVTLSGFSSYDGDYYVAGSGHSWSRSWGYTTKIKLER